MNKFEQLGFTDMDSFILVLCCLAGALGALVDYIFKRDDLVNLPVSPPNDMPWNRWLTLLLAKLSVGFISGGVVWLILSGGLIQNKDNFCRLVLMSLATGFAAPSIVSRYRMKIDDAVVSSLKKG